MMIKGTGVKRVKTHPFKYQCKRTGLRRPSPKAQQEVVKTTQAYTAGQKASDPVTQKIYIASQANKSGLNN
jgi:hypothetical protein